ncbi:MAG: glycosyltransferase family 4 protein [Desulfuromonadales bacterium]|nr:glycosyltransferase family 4 protein [Desulfuromonadales bacterium]
MKICVLTTSYPTWHEGADEIIKGKFVHDMARYLVKSGAEVHVVTQHERGTPKYELKDGVVIHRFHYFLPHHETLTKGSGIPENIKKIKNKLLVPFYVAGLIVNALMVIKKHKIPIINAHWGFPTGYIGLILKSITRSMLVTTLYGAELFPVIAGRHALIKRLLIRALTGADLLVGISMETVNAAKAISGRDDIHVIPDGIDMDYYAPGKISHEILAKYNCSGKRVIFFTGRMVERKGHRFLIEAMKIIKDENLDIKLLLGGNGPLFPYLHQLRNDLNLEDVIEMPGFLPEEDLVPILQAADLHVLPSCIDANGDTEGSATAAFEAMACGTPSIISCIGGNIGAIEEGKGACYFEAGNSNDLAEKITMLVTDHAQLDRYARESRQFIKDHYSWEESIAKYRHLLNGAVS